MSPTPTTVLLLLLSTAVASAEKIIIFDGDMDASDYEIVTEGSSPGVATLTQFPVGGNPGSFLQVDHSADSPTSATTRANTFVFNTAQIYDPAAGAIESITYSEDSISFSRLGLNTPNSQLALRQDGILYLTETGFLPGTSTTEFVSNRQENVVATDFQAFVNRTFLPNAEPDFSTGGELIEFGFVRFGNPGNFVFFQDVFGVDNFRVELAIAVPEPNTLAVLTTAITAFVIRRP